MPGTLLRKRVGPGEENLSEDVALVRVLLNKIPASAGGPASPLVEGGPVSNNADDPLFVAIRRFQTHHQLFRPGSRTPFGYVDLFGSTLAKLDQLTAVPKEPLTIVQEVGPGKPNLPDDVRVIRQLLNEVPVQLGGPVRPLADAAPLTELFEAIKWFQTYHRLGKKAGGRWQPYGFVGPEGLTLPKLNAFTDRPARTVLENRNAFLVPVQYQYKQGDSRWDWVTLNNTNTSNIGSLGCALTAVATAFTTRGIKLPDAQIVTEQLKKKARQLGQERKLDISKWTDAQLQEVTPLTLNAWLTAYDSHGFKSPRDDELSFENLASKLTGITYVGKYQLGQLQLRRAVDSGRVIIAHINGHHFVVLTGHNGGTTFFCYDVAFPDTSQEYSEIGSVVVYR